MTRRFNSSAGAGYAELAKPHLVNLGSMYALGPLTDTEYKDLRRFSEIIVRTETADHLIGLLSKTEAHNLYDALYPHESREMKDDAEGHVFMLSLASNLGGKYRVFRKSGADDDPRQVDEWGTSVERDNNGKILSVTDRNGNEIQKIEYEGDTDEIKKVTLLNAKTGKTIRLVKSGLDEYDLPDNGQHRRDH